MLYLNPHRFSVNGGACSAETVYLSNFDGPTGATTIVDVSDQTANNSPIVQTSPFLSDIIGGIPWGTSYLDLVSGGNSTFETQENTALSINEKDFTVEFIYRRDVNTTHNTVLFEITGFGTTEAGISLMTDSGGGSHLRFGAVYEGWAPNNGGPGSADWPQTFGTGIPYLEIDLSYVRVFKSSLEIFTYTVVGESVTVNSAPPIVGSGDFVRVFVDIPLSLNLSGWQHIAITRKGDYFYIAEGPAAGPTGTIVDVIYFPYKTHLADPKFVVGTWDTILNTPNTINNETAALKDVRFSNCQARYHGTLGSSYTVPSGPLT